MKTLLISFLFFLAAGTGYSQWFWLNPPQQGNTLRCVKFITPETAVAVGEFGTILKTTNAGASWIKLTSGTTTDLYGVDFRDADNGIVVGEQVRLTTTNGGTNWNMENTYPYSLYSICFTDANTGTAVGNHVMLGAVILKTTNGGLSWDEKIISSATALYSVCFTDNDHGAAAGYTSGFRGIILKTTNGGTDWTEKEISSLSGINFILFTDVNNGIATGDHSILCTTDGGINWVSSYEQENFWFYSVSFSHPDTATAVGNYYTGIQNGIIVRTTNGGLTWDAQQMWAPTALLSVDLASSANGIIVGGGGITYTTSNHGTNWNKTSDAFTYRNLRQVFFPSALVGYIVGEGGAVFKTGNGGITWIEKPTGTSYYLEDVFFTDINNGIVVGVSYDINNNSEGRILKTTNGGNDWTEQPALPNSALYKVFFTDANTGTAVGCYKESENNYIALIVRTTNGGVTWSSQTIGTLQSLSSVFFSDVNNGIITSGSGIILRTTDGGINWIPQSTPTSGYLCDVFFTDNNNGIIVAWNEILRTTDGGNNWLIQNTYCNSEAVHFADKNNGIAVGQFGRIVRTTDGGITWNTETPITNQLLYDVWFSDSSNAIVIGDFGTILKNTHVTSVKEERLKEIPKGFYLSSNYPNPFNPVTRIRYSVPQSSDILIKVYDILGSEIETLVDEEKSAGTYEINWKADNLPGGIYFCMMKAVPAGRQAGNFVSTKKMVLIK